MKKILLIGFSVVLASSLIIFNVDAATPPQNTPDWCHKFNSNLKLGDGKNKNSSKSTEVKHLQIALEKEGFSVSATEKDNGFFGTSTKAAVIAFQEKYRDEILIPVELENGNGFVGKLTRNKLNLLYICSTYKITPAGTVIMEKDYVFTAKINGRASSTTLFFLKSPNGVMKYGGVSGQTA